MEIKTEKAKPMSRSYKQKWKTINEGLKRREEVKREFQAYLYDSCQKYTEGEKDI